jgi:putative ABC transport system ATP-binding protein
VSRIYGRGGAAVVALDDVTLDLAAGEFTAVMGPSGSGKSTLMHCIAGLDQVTRGSVFVGDTEVSSLSDRQLTALRRDRIGFVFQSFNLVPTLTTRENITLPCDIAGRRVDEERLQELVRQLGLQDRLQHRPSELSGGQQQRVACARALVSRPALVVADEPTGNLDSTASEDVLEILRSAVDDRGQTVIVVTHDPVVASRADRVVFLADGRIVEELRPESVTDVASVMTRLGGQ